VDILKTNVILAVFSYSLVLLGLTYWEITARDVMGLARSFSFAFLEAYVLFFLKDVVSLAILHRVMHWPQYMWLHKYHHRWGRDTSNFYTNFSFDLIDLLLENGSGLFLLIPLKYLLFGDMRFNLLSYMALIWIDASLHSCNPYSASTLNPLLDYVFRLNLRHRLHHALITKHFTFIPWAHVLPSHRQQDVDSYNRIMETQIC